MGPSLLPGVPQRGPGVPCRHARSFLSRARLRRCLAPSRAIRGEPQGVGTHAWRERRRRRRWRRRQGWPPALAQICMQALPDAHRGSEQAPASAQPRGEGPTCPACKAWPPCFPAQSSVTISAVEGNGVRYRLKFVRRRCQSLILLLRLAPVSLPVFSRVIAVQAQLRHHGLRRCV